MRIEKDYLGSLEVPKDALYGIHARRAQQNFPDQTPFHQEWYRATALVKQACYNTYERFKKAANENYPQLGLDLISDPVLNALQKSAQEVAEGQHFEAFIVPAVNGGAGTSINMNINEIVANRALVLLGQAPGQYQFIDPIEQANVFQSTNDVIPTSLKLASMQLLNELEKKINELREGMEALEAENRDALRVAYTQMQEAVPSSWGKLFSTYSEALSRDWWRISKCFERIKVVNLGGSAVGTGIAVPRFFLMEVVRELQKISGLPITRSENLSDATANHDPLVEVHAIIKAHAVNLEKMANDFRLLASDLVGSRFLQLPQQQVGSSIMPAKVNPVIPEFVISVAHKVYANDQLVSGLCAQGCLDLNAYLPLIGHALLDSLKLLIGANSSMLKNMIQSVTVNRVASHKALYKSPAVTTALSPFIGYHQAGKLASLMKAEGLDVFEANQRMQLITNERLEQIMKPENLVKTGYSLKELAGNQKPD